MREGLTTRLWGAWWSRQNEEQVQRHWGGSGLEGVLGRTKRLVCRTGLSKGKEGRRRGQTVSRGQILYNEKDFEFYSE